MDTGIQNIATVGTHCNASQRLRNAPFLKYFFSAIFLLFFYISAYSFEIASIKIINETVDIDLSYIILNKEGNLSEKEIKNIGAMITDEYHKNGYSAAYIDKLFIRKDGVLEIHINEGRVTNIIIRGVDGDEAKAVEKILLPKTGEVFNEFVLKKRIGLAKRKLNLREIKASPERLEKGEIILDVDVEKKGGTLYGRIVMDMAYGVSPVIGYLYFFRYSALDVHFIAGYRDYEFRRIEGDVKFYIFKEDFSSALYFGLNSGRFLDRWESMSIDFTTVSVQPSIGLTCKHWIIRYYLYFSEKIARLSDYPPYSGMLYDSRLSLDFEINNRDLLLDQRETSNLRLSMSGGWDNLNRNLYFLSTINAEISIFPFTWFRVTPKMSLSYTTSVQRFFWSYVYDHNLIGFFGDYTASKWKNVLGLDTEFEIAHDLLFIGPFINSGYFIDEYDEWILKTGTGIKCRILFGKFQMDIYYAWDITGKPQEGGIFFNVVGKF